MQVIVFQQSTLLPCPFKFPPLPLLSFPLVERIAAGSRSFSRRPPRLHSITAVAAVAESKARSNLLSETEKRWQNVMDNPMEGVAFTLQEFEEALSKYDFSFEIGDTVKGVVFMTDSNGALVDIGAKAPAYLPVYEASMHRVKHVCEIGLQQGIEEEFQILREDDDNARLILSLRKLQFSVAWERCRQLQADDVTVKGKIISANKGGVVVSVEGLRGFVPFSQMFSRTNAEDLIDKSIPLKFLDVDEEQGRLILSNRRALMDGQALMDIGSVVEGIVQAVKPYGAFVNIGGISGLLHISQISNERIANVENVLSVGDKIKVMILSQDRERGRVSLSTKKLEPTPGDMLRNPALVYEKAEEMGQTFRERVAQAEAIARAEELHLQESGFGLVPDSTEANGAVNLQEQESSFLFNF